MIPLAEKDNPLPEKEKEEMEVEDADGDEYDCDGRPLVAFEFGDRVIFVDPFDMSPVEIWETGCAILEIDPDKHFGLDADTGASLHSRTDWDGTCRVTVHAHGPGLVRVASNELMASVERVKESAARLREATVNAAVHTPGNILRARTANANLLKNDKKEFHWAAAVSVEICAVAAINADLREFFVFVITADMPEEPPLLDDYSVRLHSLRLYKLKNPHADMTELLGLVTENLKAQGLRVSWVNSGFIVSWQETDNDDDDVKRRVTV